MGDENEREEYSAKTKKKHVLERNEGMKT